MGGGSFNLRDYASYSTANSKTFDSTTNRISGQVFTARNLDPSLDPSKFNVRECVNSEEHPNTIPVILALDVTGSMNQACNETAEALGVIMNNLYEKFKDIEFCIMGIGDLAYDGAPIQMSQFESDIRIAEALDKVYMEMGGGGNAYESYTAAWYMGLHHTKLDCFDKQGRKGIIITMGDEPMNPYLPQYQLSKALNKTIQADINTNDLYQEASQKFDIYHIAVDDIHDCFSSYASRIHSSFGQLLGNHLKVSTIQKLASTIEECIADSIQHNPIDGTVETAQSSANVNENNEITW